MKFKPLLGTDLSGHLGGVVASHNTYASYFRQRKHPVNRKTAPQQAQRLALQIVSAAWRSLGADVQQSWIVAKLTKKSRSGNVVTLSGQAAWMYINVLRQRLGLALISLPPSSDSPVSFTVPTVVVTAPNLLDITFDVSDEWNAVGGGVIISCTAPLGPGVQYDQSFSAVGSGAGPLTVGLSLTLPFVVPVSGTVRVRFHCSGPDGRQTLPVDVDVVIGAAENYVAVVQVVTALQALWVFAQNVTSDAAASPELMCDGVGPTSTAQGGPNSVLCTYATGHVAAGKTWGIAATPTHLTSTLPIMVPETGVQE
jgi:hypothetical protein